MFTGTVDTGGIPVDLRTLAVSIVSKTNYLNCNQLRGVKCNLSDLPLGEVVDWGMLLGAVVAQVVRSRCPEVPELALIISATQPVKLHVHCLFFVRDDCFIGDSNCSGVVTLDW